MVARRKQFPPFSSSGNARSNSGSNVEDAWETTPGRDLVDGIFLKPVSSGFHLSAV